MSLRADIAEDELLMLDPVFGFGETAQWRPDDGEPSGPVRALFSDAAEQVTPSPVALTEDRSSTVLVAAVDLAAQAVTLLGQARPPQPGDALDGAAEWQHDGAWIILSVRRSPGGNWLCACRWDRPRHLGNLHKGQP